MTRHADCSVKNQKICYFCLEIRANVLLNFFVVKISINIIKGKFEENLSTIFIKSIRLRAISNKAF